MDIKCLLFILAYLSSNIDTAKILAVYPTPSISHQIVFRKVTLELIKQGHEVTVVTTDPAFSKIDRPKNLTEIDVHDVSYKILYDTIDAWVKTKKSLQSSLSDLRQFVIAYKTIFEAQIQTSEFKELLSDKKKQFDLIMIEELSRPALAMSYVFNAPVILFSSLFGRITTHNIFGSMTHPLLYSSHMSQRFYNLTLWEKIEKLFKHYIVLYALTSYEKDEHEMLQSYFGSNIPSIRELYKNVDMIFLNVHSTWVENQPVPPNIIYLGGLHQTGSKALPKDLQTYLDTSKHGVIYVSFGTNALSTLLQSDKIEALAKVLGQLPYDVLWKWDKDELPGRTKNIRISKWYPQADLLKHPNIKLFITQAGLQSTDEAITAGVPLVAFPVLGDQWFNAEKYVRFGIGRYILFTEATEVMIRSIINDVITDETYKKNIVKLRERIQDQPETPLQRAMFWIDYVIRHKGAKHLQAAGAHLTWTQYYEIEVLFVLCCIIFIFFISFITGIYCLYKLIAHVFGNNNKQKQS